MNENTTKVIIGVIAAAIAGGATFLLGQNILTPELATIVSAVAAFVGGYITPKSVGQ